MIDTNPLSYVVKEGRNRSRDRQGEQRPEWRALATGCFNLHDRCSGCVLGQSGRALSVYTAGVDLVECPHQS